MYIIFAAKNVESIFLLHILGRKVTAWKLLLNSQNMKRVVNFITIFL